MRLVALLCWYDERPDWLAGVVASVGRMGAAHIVALDGAYALLPEGRGRSPAGQAEAIQETARGLGMGCTIHEPQARWGGNEVEKRDALFRFGEMVTGPDDWYLIMDGDEFVTSYGHAWRERLTTASEDVGEVTLWRHRKHTHPEERPFVLGMVEEQPIRVLFRALRGLRVIGNHYTYVTSDGRYLWGDARHGLEPVVSLPDIRIEHRTGRRDLWRRKQAKDYYRRRDEIGIERSIPKESICTL